MKGAYYNEHDRAKAAWLRHLIEEGAIARGAVDERPIQQVEPDDLADYDQHHFFAGIGVWSYALRLAGVADDDPWWTGSCPCGPFSSAGKRLGFEDPRHLWPEWFRLIRQCRPHRILGEQSDAADAWIDLVSADLEALGYAIGTPDIPAAGFGGAHIRQRFYWVADADNTEWWSERAPWHDGQWPKTGRLKGNRDAGERRRAGGLGDAYGGKPWNGHLQRSGEHGQFAQDGGPVDWLFCRDRRWRPVEPGTSPLVDATPARLGRLRGYGDAIDAETAASFVAAYLAASHTGDGVGYGVGGDTLKGEDHG